MTTKFIAKAKLPTCFGNFQIYAFIGRDRREHIALVSGKTTGIVNVRIHSKCLTGDTFCSLRCDCRAQLEASLKFLAKNKGILLYLDQEGRGIGLTNKIRAYALQEKGYDTMEANLKLGFPVDMRRYEVAADMLRYLKVKKINLITNNPKKLVGLEGDGIGVIKRLPIAVILNKHNRKYIETKRNKMGHLYPNCNCRK